MHIISKSTLKDFWEQHPQAKAPLEEWYSRVKRNDFSSPQEIKANFGTTLDFLSENRIIFDIGGNKYRLIVRSVYEKKRFYILFIGTHKDYDRLRLE